jgi:hypothetical protein
MPGTRAPASQESISVVQIAIPGFRDYRQTEMDRGFVVWDTFYQPINQRVSNHADAVRVGDRDWTFQSCGARHFSISVKRKPGPEDAVMRVFAARQNYSYSRSNGALANDELSFACDKRRMPDFYTFDIGDCIKRTGRSIKWNTQVTSPGLADAAAFADALGLKRIKIALFHLG